MYSEELEKWYAGTDCERVDIKFDEPLVNARGYLECRKCKKDVGTDPYRNATGLRGRAYRIAHFLNHEDDCNGIPSMKKRRKPVQ